MPRLARVVIPGAPHHVVQRGNRRQQTFFGPDDYGFYKDLLAEWARRAEVEVWAWCLMPNHVHLILTPAEPDGLHRALGEAHRRYTRHVNARAGWTGYLWQGRFSSAPMDEAHLLAAFRYLALNPVRAGIVKRVEEWRWSSARAHLRGRGDGLVRVAPLLERVADPAAFFAVEPDAEAERTLRRAERTGRPAGAPTWVAELEARTGRVLAPGRRGRKPAVALDCD